MATEIPRTRILANFRPSVSERMTEKRRDDREDRDGNSNAHLDALRRCPCIATLKMPAGEVHHLKFGTGERGMGLRSSDRWGLPITRIPHEEIERAGSRNERAKLKEFGIDDPLGLAAALWAASPNVAMMTRIILAHKGKKT